MYVYDEANNLAKAIQESKEYLEYKKAKQKVKNEFNWAKIAQDTHFTYQKAICETMAERQQKQIKQEFANKTIKAGQGEAEIAKLIKFNKRQAYA